MSQKDFLATVTFNELELTVLQMVGKVTNHTIPNTTIVTIGTEAWKLQDFTSCVTIFEVLTFFDMLIVDRTYLVVTFCGEVARFACHFSTVGLDRVVY